MAVAAIAAVSGLSMANAESEPASSCPITWSCGDIGGATPAGGQALANGTWQLEGGGSDIWGLADQFHYVWQGLETDGSVSASVLSQTDADQNAKAGVMLRSSTDPDSAYYAVFLTPAHGLVVQYRTGTGVAATNAGGQSITVPSYVSAVRSGSTFTAMVSTDGETWTNISGSSEYIPALASNLLAGVAVTSHNPNLTSSVTFGAVQVLGSPASGSGEGTRTSDVGPSPDGAVGSAGSPPTTTTAPAPTTTTAAGTGSTPGTGTLPPNHQPTGGGSGSTTTTTTTSPATKPVLPSGLSSSARAPTGASSAPGQVSVCGTALCVDGSTWSMYGSTIYNPGLNPYQSGIKDPSGTIALVKEAHLNTIRITDFLDVTGDPSTAPYNKKSWRYVDAIIAAASAAGLHVDLSLSDFRATLWNSCVDPYTADWTRFVSFVANRVNTVSHVMYKDDPTIAFVSVAGEPLPVGTYKYKAKTTGQPCTMTYSSGDLTWFYAAVTYEWKQQGGNVLINSGGLGYLNEGNSGIPWKSIFSLSTNDFCDIKTYGGMQAWAPTAAAYCHSIGKPIIVEEFGWQQGAGDSQRAKLFVTMFAELHALNVAGMAFWNLGYQLAPTSYEVNPSTPLTFWAIKQNAP
jgi:hypothetical protein